MPLILTRATLEMLLDDVVVKTGLLMRVCMPARVVSYFPPVPGPRPTPPRAMIQIDLKYAREGHIDDVDLAAMEVFQPAADAREPGELVGSYPMMIVPIHFPGPWGMWARGPLLPGELGKLVWCDRSIDSWQVDGGSPTGPTDPGFGHTHGGMTGGPMNDCWFEPGLRSGFSMGVGPAGTLPSVVDPVAWEIGTADGLSTLKITAPGGGLPVMMELKTAGATLTLDALTVIKGGALAVQFLAKAPPLVQLLTALASDLSTWVPAPMDGGLALKTKMLLPGGFLTIAAGLIGQISCTKMQGE